MERVILKETIFFPPTDEYILVGYQFWLSFLPKVQKRTMKNNRSRYDIMQLY